MSARSHQAVDPDHRVRVLRALGLTPWVRRAPAVAPLPELQIVDSGAGVACVVVLPEQCSARELDLLGRALSTGGAWLARAARVRVKDGQLTAELPMARAYLVFGEAQAHALGRILPAAVMNQALIVLADEPSLVLGSAAAKRRLWNALRSLRRALLATAGE
ncbi:MAG: hypothetical protein EPN69_05465 [Rhodanobacter sp.]|nr:MAG: hypothetical protein EPN69_05465 [Rhodanobacter sp.]TAM06093.1 MAG: hypothetical protein EPN71_01290 [Rhodanobacter sp.]TAM39805.1 MAG: hypothetical protein EPN58_12650 [Rhodanobacter sp.]TAN29408.1 MAG: hypothetical protein EPN32_00580 [Rhodanobacter sp.]